MTATPKPSPIRWISTIALCLLSLQSALAEEGPSVSELLDKYAQTQDKLQKSFVIKEERTVVIRANHGFLKGTRTRYEVSETHYDGERIRKRTKMWGKFARSSVPKNRPKHVSRLWDGNSFYQYSSKSEDDPGLLFLFREKDANRNKDPVTSDALGGFVTGGPRAAEGGSERVDATLRRSDSISVRNRMQVVNSSKCYVIGALTKHGKYTVWLDPQHGYNIAKMEVVKTGGDLFTDRGPQPKGSTMRVSLKNVRFKLVDDIWLPVEGVYEIKRRSTNGKYIDSISHIKRTEITLNPDQEALGPFLPDDIVNGTKVYISGIKGVKYNLRPLWQDGKVVDKNGRVVLEVSRDPAPSPKAKPLKISKE